MWTRAAGQPGRTCSSPGEESKWSHSNYIAESIKTVLFGQTLCKTPNSKGHGVLYLQFPVQMPGRGTVHSQTLNSKAAFLYQAKILRSGTRPLTRRGDETNDSLWVFSHAHNEWGTTTSQPVSIWKGELWTEMEIQPDSPDMDAVNMEKTEVNSHSCASVSVGFKSNWPWGAKGMRYSSSPNTSF